MRNLLVLSVTLVSLNFPQYLYSQPMNATLSLQEDYVLEVPLVNYGDNPGQYQNTIFKSAGSEAEWTLVSADVGTLIGSVDAVEVVVTSETPVQVFLEVSGTFGTGCPRVGKYAINMHGNVFNVFLYYDPDSLPSPEIDCTTEQVQFSKTIPLPVYGLDAGAYSFAINERVSGNFEITTDNVLPN